MLLTKNQVFYVTITLIFIFFLVYTPHLVNPFPIHVDEWRHITESIKLKQGLLPTNFSGIEIGFHIFLMILSFFTDLILIYKFLPAIWAVLTSLILFFIIKKQTSNLKSTFLISLLTIIFFASIKSNVNITGLWFFIPLTFSIPFIYLYIYLFTTGIQQQNKKYILLSLAIMLLLIPTHSISVLFAIPILIIFSLFHIKYIIKHWKFFSLFLLIPILGIIFFSQLFNITLTQAFFRLISELQFRHGWGILELNNSLFELYSPFGYLLAILGLIFLGYSKQRRQKYMIYIIWPVIVLISILIFRFTGISYLSPYQRNLYYFVISLPILSSFGLYSILKFIKLQTNKIAIEKREKTFQTLKLILIILTIILIFSTYYSLPKNIKLYKVIGNEEYETLRFLKTLPKTENSKVMAPASTSVALFPISRHEPVGTIFFYGNRDDVELFFKNETTCETKQELINKHNVNYVLSEGEIDCNYTDIYNQNNITIYEINIKRL